jgi:hypothetical protein
MARARLRSESSDTIAAASRSGLRGGTMRPVVPSSTISEAPPISVATTGTPQASASLSTAGEASQSTEGRTETSSAAVISGTSSRKPRKRTAS